MTETEIPSIVVPHVPVGGEAPPLQSAFLFNAAGRPDLIAVIADGETVSYGRLERWSCWVAGEILRRGFDRGDWIGIDDQGGWKSVAALIGILRAGMTVYPFDPQLPAERVRAQALLGPMRLMVCPGGSASAAAAAGLDCLSMALTVEPPIDEEPTGQYDPDPADIAFLIPPGIVMEQGAVAFDHVAPQAVLGTILARFAIGSQDRILSLAPLTSMNGLLDLFAALSTGATLVLERSDREPEALVDAIARHGVTVADVTPSVARALAEAVESGLASFGPALRLMLLTCERTPLAVAKRLRRLAPTMVLASWTGVGRWALPGFCFEIDEIDPAWTRLPQGQPLHGTKVRIVNDRMQPCPTWVPGEICLGGTGLALGLVLRDGVVEDAPSLPGTGEFFLRSEQIGLLRSEGMLEQLGTRDQLARVDGHRVDAMDVENAIGQAASVLDCAVLIEGGETLPRVTAFIVAEENGTSHDLTAQLRALLPDHLLPDRVLLRAALPLTIGGCRDEAALAVLAAGEELGEAEPEESDAVDPLFDRTMVQLMTIAAATLQVEVGDPKANLLDLGATSIDVIRVINKIEEEFGPRLPVDEFFRWPSLHEAAKLLRRISGDVPLERGAAGQPDVAPPDNAILTDPDERDRFKRERRALRTVSPGWAVINLATAGETSVLPPDFAKRRSERRFSGEPVPFDRLAGLLSCLRDKGEEGQPKFSYPSAGGAYPVQTYLYVKGGRVAGLAGGCYYYHPAAHRLQATETGATLDRTAFDWINQPVFDQAAFGLFLVGQRYAIEPLYGLLSHDFSMLEAGAMGQTLSLAAPALGLGVCWIGSVDQAVLTRHFHLDGGNFLACSLLGGLFAQRPAESAGGGAQPIFDMLERLEKLSKQDVARLLAEHQDPSDSLNAN